MKLIVAGFGQCGGRIADEFRRMNRKSRFHRGIEIVAGTFAVNTDAADLSSLASIKSDYQHRILIGNRKTSSHGVGRRQSEPQALGARLDPAEVHVGGEI